MPPPPTSPTAQAPPPPPALLPLQFVLTTDPSVGSMGEALSFIYSQLFVECVVKNPLYTPGDPFL